MVEAFPLYWPDGQARTPRSQRRWGAFKTGFAIARDQMIRELELLGAKDVVISTNIPLRRDGLPYAGTSEPEDSGAAVYFNHAQRAIVIACDSYQHVKSNLRAIGATVEALRTIKRHGASELLERAFTGFAALPPAGGETRPWWQVLEVPRDAKPDQVRSAYRALAAKHHPDMGGDSIEMAKINCAYEEATR